ncbi:MAG: exo-poly-alpha-D-galacturonosidase [Rhodocyclales bacterium]|nr:exo-poly-alpha-D-galacturonosidase [Rhodocyclales bacterium]
MSITLKSRLLPALLVVGLFILPTGAPAQAPAPAPAIELQIITQSIDSSSLLLAWRKPATNAGIADYEVFMDGKLLGSALGNARKYSAAQAYIDKFYAEDVKNIHVKIAQHNFFIEGLAPASAHQFSVRAIMADGTHSPESLPVTARTTDVPKPCDITAQGARGDGVTLNTAAIQKTIEQCPDGGTVRIPKGTFRSGAIFLKRHMTLELTEGATLLGSEHAEDYPLGRGYLLYDYTSTKRPPSLINAIAPPGKNANDFGDIRIVGQGVIDGNGWKQQAEQDVTDETDRMLPQYIAANNKSVLNDGILAAAQVKQALSEGLSAQVAYSQRRSSLMTLRGVHKLYIAGITLRNPAFHGAMVQNSEDVVINGIRVETFDANNGDGIEFGNSRNVSVMNSFFDTGDDCVNFAAGAGEEAIGRPPQQFAWIFNNYFRHGHGAVVIGSHTGAWIEDVLAEDNVINQTWSGLRAKSNSINGGGGRRIVYRDNAHRDTRREAFIVTLDYADSNTVIDYPPAKIPAKFEDILVQHNSVEFTDTASARKQPAYSTIVVQGDLKTNTLHERIVFNDLILVNARPIKIDGLRNGELRDITFVDYKRQGEPWKITNAPGMSVVNVKQTNSVRTPPANTTSTPITR